MADWSSPQRWRSCLDQAGVAAGRDDIGVDRVAARRLEQEERADDHQQQHGDRADQAAAQQDQRAAHATFAVAMDWTRVRRAPSLPDISPAGGRLAGRFAAPFARCRLAKRQTANLPPAGEMSGRTEGGNVEHEPRDELMSPCAHIRLSRHPSIHVSAQLETAQRGLLETFFTDLRATVMKPHSATLISGRSAATSFWKSL